MNKNLGYDDVCKEKHVKIVFYNLGQKFLNATKSDRSIEGIVIVTGELKKYPMDPTVKTNRNVAQYWELEDIFFKQNNIKPEWLWIREKNRGLLNETTGQWDGGVGHIQRDEADYAVRNYPVSYSMSRVVALSPTSYAPLHWVTRRDKVSPILNLLGLFTKVLLLSLKSLLFKL